jgi:hypothetical protein
MDRITQKFATWRANGGAWVAPPPPIRCTITPVDLDMTESSWFGVVTTLSAAVHCSSLSVDRLTAAESSNFGVVTAPTGVHYHWHDGAPLLSVRCHRLVSIESRGNRGGHRPDHHQGVAVHHPIYLERRENGGSARVAPPPLVWCHRPGDQLAVGRPLKFDRWGHL